VTKAAPASDTADNVLTFQNRQRTKRVDTPLLRRITLHVLQNELGVSAFELGFHLVNAREMAHVNQTFLQHTGSTDVITFDHSEESHRNSSTLHGEVFISIPDAIVQAREFSTTWQSELVRYVIHGLLHLRGFDDLKPELRREMKREENRLLKAVEQNFAVSNIERSSPTARKR
jgi:probable rRNA maturation factor